jgi:3-hydroxy-3-methylglutaryl CoA synthase
VVVAAADLGGGEVFTVDCGNSLRAGTSALKMAVDSVKAGSAKSVVVAAADCRMAPPLSGHEQNIGDGESVWKGLVHGHNILWAPQGNPCIG